MISVTHALEKVIQQAQTPRIEERSLSTALHFTLAHDVFSPMNWPTHPQAAMDGYGLCRAQWKRNDAFVVKHIVQAGDYLPAVHLQAGEAIRIFTGAVVPEGVDTIIQQEHIRVENGQLLWPDVCPPLAQHIRPAASQTHIGEKVASKGNVLTAARCAFLSGLGIEKVAVFEHPRIAVVCTGSELTSPGEILLPGKIFESNSMALKQALLARGMDVNEIILVPDDAEQIEQTLQRVLDNFDVALITGGVSVGDYDLVVPTLTRLGVETILHKVKQKPGKPFYFGRTSTCAIFGLPGNPASVLTCFYMYTLPYLDACEQRTHCGLPYTFLPLPTAYTKKAGLTHFVRARVDGGAVTILPNQESYKMNSFAEANAMLVLDEDLENPSEGTLVHVYCF